MEETGKARVVAGLEGLASLMELYASDNRIAEVLHARHLAPLTRLLVLDLSGNPVATALDFRPFLIYSMPGLKVRAREHWVGGCRRRERGGERRVWREVGREREGEKEGGGREEEGGERERTCWEKGPKEGAREEGRAGASTTSRALYSW